MALAVFRHTGCDEAAKNVLVVVHVADRKWLTGNEGVLGKSDIAAKPLVESSHALLVAARVHEDLLDELVDIRRSLLL